MGQFLPRGWKYRWANDSSHSLYFTVWFLISICLLLRLMRREMTILEVLRKLMKFIKVPVAGYFLVLNDQTLIPIKCIKPVVPNYWFPQNLYYIPPENLRNLIISSLWLSSFFLCYEVGLSLQQTKNLYLFKVVGFGSVDIELQ